MHTVESRKTTQKNKKQGILNKLVLSLDLNSCGSIATTSMWKVWVQQQKKAPLYPWKLQQKLVLLVQKSSFPSKHPEKEGCGRLFQNRVHYQEQLMEVMDVAKDPAVKMKGEDLAHAYDAVRVANKSVCSFANFLLTFSFFLSPV